LVQAKKRRWCKFMVDPALPDLDHLEQEDEGSLGAGSEDNRSSRAEDARPMLGDDRDSAG
jgi:hypothetical protein